MIDRFYPVLAAFVINLVLTIYSIQSYKFIIGVGWDKFVKRLAISIGIKFVLLLLLALITNLIIDIANLYFVLSFSVFMIIQIIIEIWYLVKISKRLKE